MKEQLLFDLKIAPSGPSTQEQPSLTPRLNSPVRKQIIFKEESIDNIIPGDHRVRQVWSFVNTLDFTLFTNEIKSVEGGPGRDATDPKLLFSLWLFAIIEGIGSARTLTRYCSEHKAFIWLCGGVKVNHHTLSDFRSNNSHKLDDLFTQTIAALMNSGIVSLKRVAQDGMRVRASAGRSSFKRKPKLRDHLKEAKKRVKELKKEIDMDPGAYTRREKSAKERAARERVEKLEAACRAMKEINKKIDENQAQRSKKEMIEAKKS